MILTHHVINTNGKVNFVNGKNTEVVVEDGENAANITVNLKDDINVKSVKANKYYRRTCYY